MLRVKDFLLPELRQGKWQIGVLERQRHGGVRARVLDEPLEVDAVGRHPLGPLGGRLRGLDGEGIHVLLLTQPQSHEIAEALGELAIFLGCRRVRQAQAVRRRGAYGLKIGQCRDVALDQIRRARTGVVAVSETQQVGERAGVELGG